ncbi:MAG TPA: group II intron reverse transcriptase/maturase [Prolixibacteraceae bacterium]|nr:group II intron reverse transcriptase/maturase [Prolixibacteraceae bacterium]
MDKAKKAANSGQCRNYQQEAGMESRVNAGEQSYAKACTEGKDESELNTKYLLEAILDRDNLNAAYKRVKQNAGSPGVDKMKVEALFPFLRQHGESLKQSILGGTYKPQPVKRVEIDKPDGGVRLLGIPTVIDRMIQQAISQVLTPIFEKEFSTHSYGFRPKRNAHQAIKQAQEYINEGYKTVVDIDLEKFFDRVNHDKLMYLLSVRIEDKRLLKLIRAYLESGVMIGGLFSPSDEGTPQGGPLSPLLSNVMLHELDKELEKRGHRFCRYADDCNIYVKSKRAGSRVMASIGKFIEEELQLKVNQSKSAVDSPTKRKFLGFSFYYSKGAVNVKLHSKTLDRIKTKVKTYTKRSNGKSIEERITDLDLLIKGWVNYYKLADMRKHCQRLDEWMRRRLRMCIWKQWKKIGCRHKNLVKLGINYFKAWEYANTRKGYWHTSNSPILACSLTNAYFKDHGLFSFTEVYNNALNSMNRRMPNGTYGGVRGQ